MQDLYRYEVRVATLSGLCLTGAGVGYVLNGPGMVFVSCIAASYFAYMLTLASDWGEADTWVFIGLSLTLPISHVLLYFCAAVVVLAGLERMMNTATGTEWNLPAIPVLVFVYAPLFLAAL